MALATLGATDCFILSADYTNQTRIQHYSLHTIQYIPRHSLKNHQHLICLTWWLMVFNVLHSKLMLSVSWSLVEIKGICVACRWNVGWINLVRRQG